MLAFLPILGLIPFFFKFLKPSTTSETFEFTLSPNPESGLFFSNFSGLGSASVFKKTFKFVESSTVFLKVV